MLMDFNGTYGFSASHDMEHILEHISITIDRLMASLAYAAGAELLDRYL